MELTTIAVLISEERYQQLFNTDKGVFQAIMQWREQYSSIDLAAEEVNSWRDRTPAREFSWN